MSRIPRIIYISSSEIFGDIKKEKITEFSPFNPKSGYAISKLAGEQYIQGFHKEFGLEYSIIRFFNVYGPGQVAEFVVPRFVTQVMNDIAPTVYGDGRQIRSFCHIDDVAAAVVQVLLCNDLLNKVVNVGNDQEPVTMTELAEKVIEQSGKELQPAIVPFESSDRTTSREIFYRVPDTSLLREKTGFKAKITLARGIDKLIKSGNIPLTWATPSF